VYAGMPCSVCQDVIDVIVSLSNSSVSDVFMNVSMQEFVLLTMRFSDVAKFTILTILPFCQFENIFSPHFGMKVL
jgi:hypothetical protein